MRFDDIIVWCNKHPAVFAWLAATWVAHLAASSASHVLAHTLQPLPQTALSKDASASRVKSAGARRLFLRAPLRFIAARNLFAAPRENLDPKAQAAVVQEVSQEHIDPNDLKQCTLRGTLRATIVAQDNPAWSMAVFYDNTEKQPIVLSINPPDNRVGSDGEVVRIEHNAIIVRRKNRYEQCLTQDQALAKHTPSPSAAASSNSQIKEVAKGSYEIERAVVDSALSNLSQLATQARVTPSFRNGKANGFRIFAIKPESLFKKIGLKNGDIIHEINGNKLNSLEQGMQIYQKLKDASSLDVQISRRRRQQTLSYTIR